MVLWVDKYRPTSLAKLDLHPGINSRLQSLVDSPDFPHLLFYGPSGGGKKTRIHALLRALYGTGIDKVRVQVKQIKLKSKQVELATLQSNYHIELTPSEVGNNDRQVVQEVIKEIAQTTNVASAVQVFSGGGGSESKASSTSSGSGEGKGRLFKVVVLNEVDGLSMAAQQALRRTMEKYTYSSEQQHNTGTRGKKATRQKCDTALTRSLRCLLSARPCRVFRCRLILVCESLSKVIPPLRSRCLPVRVPAPQTSEVSISHQQTSITSRACQGQSTID